MDEFKSENMTLFKYIISFWLISLFCEVSFAQKQNYTNEIGFDLYQIRKQISDKNERKKTEIIYKVISHKKDWRLKIYKAKGEYREVNTFVRYVPITNMCIDGKGYQTRYTYNLSWGMTIGFVRKLHVKKCELYFGLDGKVQLNKGRVNVYKEFCTVRENGTHYSYFSYIRQNRNNDKTIGLIPVAGVKIPLKQRIFFTFELGLPFNYRFGERIFFDRNPTYNSIDFNYSYTDKALISDISVSYLF